MKYCSKCGTQLTDGAIVCSGCGCFASRKRKIANPPMKEKIYYDPTMQVENQLDYEDEYINIEKAKKQPKKDNTNYYQASSKRSSLGVASIILAIVGILLNCFMAIFGHAGAIVAIVLGIIAITKASRDEKGYIGLGLGVLAELFAIINSLIGSSIGAQIGANIGSMFAGM